MFIWLQMSQELQVSFHRAFIFPTLISEAIRMKRNPRKVRWTKAFRKAAGKEMTIVSLTSIVPVPVVMPCGMFSGCYDRFREAQKCPSSLRS